MTDIELAAFVTARLDEGGLPPRVTETLRVIVAEIKSVRKLTELTGGKPDPYRDWILRHLASAWSDHPDYRPERKP